MLTTAKIIEMIKKYNVQNGKTDTDYYVAKTLGIAPQAMSSLRKNGNVFSDPTAMKAASILDLDPEYVIACLHAERARNEPSAYIWKNIVHRLEGAAAAAFIFAITLNLPIF